jgi:fumarate reductase subunit D
MKNAEKELAEIKSMMERSTRFLSLSGLSGVLAGTYALLGATLAYHWIYFPNPPYGFDYSPDINENTFFNLIIASFTVLGLSIGTAWLLSQKKSKRISQKIWTPAGKRFVLSLFTPVLVGGLFCFALMYHEYYLLIVPATLIFYGIALVNSSQFSLSDIKYLGFCQIILGIISSFFPAYGLIIWALGFGIMHIFYGTLMHLKYDR